MKITPRRSKGSVIVAALLFFILTPPQVSADTDGTIKQAIEEAAAKSPELRDAEVSVAVEKGRVILFGSVRLLLHKLTYAQIAWQTEGVVVVDNEIRVVPQASLSDAAIERKVWDIVELHEQFHASEFKVMVERGDVFLVATFDSPLDVILLRKSVAAIEGVITIEIEVAFRV